MQKAEGLSGVGKRDCSCCLPLLPYTSSSPGITLLAVSMWVLLGTALTSPQPSIFCAHPSSARARPPQRLTRAIWAALDLNPPVEIISVTLQAVSGFILEFIKFQCHPYS